MVLTKINLNMYLIIITKFVMVCFFTIKVFVQFKAYYYLIFLLSFFNEKCLHDTHNIYIMYIYMYVYMTFTHILYEN